MMKDTVLITGASSGLGREMARIVSKDAQKLILVGRNAERLDELKKELESAVQEPRIPNDACGLRK